MDQQRCIGKANDLPWHISADLKHFKEITQGGVVVMGRKTLESMGHALPKRVNWVITRDQDWNFAGVKTAHSIDAALEQAIPDSSPTLSSMYKVMRIIQKFQRNLKKLRLKNKINTTYTWNGDNPFLV
ncbi:unnamed protein product [Oppiella nova]|uniref:dihydrofolate reductase n=1 Tax=Oppiella nova TaxID=334625 RepID=A0A7R9MUW4_9ACAR|nr:unnamed protein product [Oppiella nova]CAG2182781.1 unnamed protein product [Oppiella nova]